MGTQETARQPAGPPFELTRRDWLLALGFVVAVFVCDRLLAHSPYASFLPREHPQNQVQMLAQRLRPEPVDVLILGSSRVEAGVDPRVVASTLWNPEREYRVARLPVLGMRAFLLHQVLENLVAHDPPSELLVIGLEERYFFPLSSETDESLGPKLLGSARDWFLVPPWLLRPHDLGAVARAPLRGVQAAWNLPLLADPALDEYLEHLWATGGLPERNFREFTRADLALVRAAAERTVGPGEDGAGELLASELAVFQKSLDLLAKLPGKVAFVRMPVARAYDEDHAAQLAKFETEVVAKVRALGFEYFDLNRIPVLRVPQLQTNPTHANTVGRTAASRALGLTLVAPLVLGDRIGPPQREALAAMFATEGMSLRPPDMELSEADQAAIAEALRAEVAARDGR